MSPKGMAGYFFHIYDISYKLIQFKYINIFAVVKDLFDYRSPSCFPSKEYVLKQVSS